MVEKQQCKIFMFSNIKIYFFIEWYFKLLLLLLWTFSNSYSGLWMAKNFNLGNVGDIYILRQTLINIRKCTSNSFITILLSNFARWIPPDPARAIDLLSFIILSDCILPRSSTFIPLSQTLNFIRFSGERQPYFFAFYCSFIRKKDCYVEIVLAVTPKVMRIL